MRNVRERYLKVRTNTWVALHLLEVTFLDAGLTLSGIAKARLDGAGFQRTRLARPLSTQRCRVSVHQQAGRRIETTDLLSSPYKAAWQRVRGVSTHIRLVTPLIMG